MFEGESIDGGRAVEDDVTVDKLTFPSGLLTSS